MNHLFFSILVISLLSTSFVATAYGKIDEICLEIEMLEAAHPEYHALSRPTRDLIEFQRISLRGTKSQMEMTQLIDEFHAKYEKNIKEIPNKDLEYLVEDYIKRSTNDRGYIHGCDGRSDMAACNFNALVDDSERKKDQGTSVKDEHYGFTNEGHNSIIGNAINNIPYTRWERNVRDVFDPDADYGTSVIPLSPEDSKKEFLAGLERSFDSWKLWAVDGMLLKELQARIADGRLVH